MQILFLLGGRCILVLSSGGKRVRQYLVSESFLEQPVLASGSCIAAIYKAGFIDAYKIVADLVHHGQQAVSSTLFEGFPVEV